MGFDEARNDDLVVTSEGIALVVSPKETGLLDGLTLDYVEYEPGDFRFIFVNPNDAGGAPAADGSTESDVASAGCGSGGCGCKGGAA
jgi:iron-sulfur cluster assembly protein